MLVICVEAGLGLTAAIERVTSEIRDLYPELAAELTAVNAEMRSGVDRSTALQGLNARTGLPEIRGLVSLMVQTLQLGTGVADSLRIYSSEFRDQRMQLELPRFGGQVNVLVPRYSLHAALPILPDSESAAAGGRRAAVLALA